VLSAADWHAGSSVLRAGAWDISHRVDGADGPDVTLVHGFPTSSWDWARVVDGLAGEARLVSFDLLGQGYSAKPAGHAYSVGEQADILEAVWAAAGVRDTLLVAHDLGATVALEALARHAEGALPVRLRGVVLLNGGLYPELHRPTAGQQALADPEHGPAVAAMLTAELFTAGLAETFGPEHRPGDAELAALWAIVSHDDGQLRMPEILAYMEERRRKRERWVGALEATDLPLRFVWGMLDPISGAHIAARLAERFPPDRLDALADVGHWPAIEDPAAVIAAVRALGRVS
jgi:pimeloyl-ACP methyl ester carboxylesterase